MLTLRKSNDRGHITQGWLDTYHTFSFGDYIDPNHTGFRNLRVINEDRIQPGKGFGTHPHNDMEIITYLMEGELEHKDSMGNGSVIHAGEIQRMTAGTGVQHSEFNPSENQSTHLLQIWLLPESKDLTPSYSQLTLPTEEVHHQLFLVASQDGRDKSIKLNADANVYVSKLDKGDTLSFTLNPERNAWIQVTQGPLTVNNNTLATGDGAAITKEQELAIKAEENAEFLLFDLP